MMTKPMALKDPCDTPGPGSFLKYAVTLAVASAFVAQAVLAAPPSAAKSAHPPTPAPTKKTAATQKPAQVSRKQREQKASPNASEKASAKSAASARTKRTIASQNTPTTPVPTPAPTPAPIKEEPKARTIDVVREEMFKTRKSKQARAVGKAIELLKQGKTAEARKATASFESSDLFGDYAAAISASSWIEEGLKKTKNKKHAEAADAARKAIPHLLKLESDYPHSPLFKKVPEELVKAELTIADSNALRKQWKKAVPYYERAFQRLLSQNLLPTLKPETFKNYGQSCKHSKAESCEAWINRFAAAGQKQSEEIKALTQALGKESLEAPALPRFDRLTRNYKAPDLDQVAFEGGMTAYMAGDYSRAIQQFRSFLDEFPKSAHRFRARFWLAQALTHDQDHEKAQKLYESLLRETPFGNYGLFASMVSGKSLENYVSAALPIASATDPHLLPHELFRLKRAERFVAEGLRELAIYELKDLRPRDNLSSEFLLYLASLHSDAANHLGTFLMITELIQRGYEGVYTSYVARMVFPVPHLPLIQKYAAQFKLDPILVLSLIKQESAFDTGAVSHVGASGLMQLMPATAVDTESDLAISSLTEAEVNIRVGTKYLRKVLDRFNGNIAFALAGYNAGPNAVQRWIREGRAKQGLLEFIEQIPYKETRDYVGSIIRNYYWYRKNLTGEQAKPLSYFWNMYGPPEVQSELPAPTSKPAEDPEI